MAFHAGGASAEGYYHTLTPYGGQTTTRQLFSVWLAPVADSSYRRILHTHFTTGPSADSHQLIKLNNNKIAICRGSGNTAALSAATDAAITGGEWIHLLAWCESSAAPSLWLNGVKQSGSNTAALGTGSNNSRLYIGMRSSQDAPYKGDVAELAYWITNTDSELPEPSDAEAMALYRSGNPWSYKPDVLRVVRPVQKVDQPAIYLGAGVGPSVKVGTPTQSAEHAPITRSDISFVRSIAGGGGVTVEAALESISLSANAATTALDISIAAALESLLITENQASVSTDITVSGSLEAIQVAGNAASIAVDVSISGSQEQITVTENPASIGMVIDATAEQITLSAFVAAISTDRTISGSLETIQVSEFAGSITLGSGLNTSLETITLTENQSTIALDTAISASLETIILNELSAQIGLGQNINASLESLTLTESGAIITLDTGISATLESISLSTLSATITSSTLAPTTPGLEYTMAGSKLHFTLPVNRLNFTFKNEG